MDGERHHVCFCDLTHAFSQGINAVGFAMKAASFFVRLQKQNTWNVDLIMSRLRIQLARRS
jgi:hypothetical protein